MMLRLSLALVVLLPGSQARDAYELNDSFASAKDVALDQDLSATISPLGDRDHFRVTVDAPGYLRVILEKNPKGLHPALAILADEKKPLAEFNPHYKDRAGKNVAIEAELPGPGKYVVRLHDGKGFDGDPEDNFASEDPYRLRVEFVPVPDALEPNDAPEKASPLALNKPLRAALFPKGDVDRYRVDLPEPGLGLLSVWLSRVPENVNPKIVLLGPGDRKVEFIPHYKRRHGADLSWNLETWSPGPYVISFQDGTGWDGDPENNASSSEPYQIEASFAPCQDRKTNKTLAQAEEIKPGATSRSALFPAGTLRFYRIPIPEPGLGRLNLSVTDLPDTVAPDLALLRLKPAATLQGLDEAEWRKRFDDWRVNPQPGKDLSPFEAVAHYHPYYRRVERLPACLCADLNRGGDYYVVLRDGRAWDTDKLDDQSGIDLFTLWAEFSGVTDPHEPCDTPEQARPLPAGKPVPITLFPDGDRDVFTFTLEKGAQVDLALAGISPALAPLVELLDASGRKLPFPEIYDARPAVLSARLAAPGKYFLSFKDRNGRSSKDAFIALLHREDGDPDPAEPNDAPERATPLKAGQDLRASLFPENDVDLYAVEAPGPARLQLKVTDLPGVAVVPVSLLDQDGKTVLLTQSVYAPPEPLAGRHALLTWESREKRRYYLQVGAPGMGPRSASVRPYVVRWDALEKPGLEAGTNDAAAAATPLESGTWAEETLFPRTDVDVFSIELKEPGSLAAWVQNPGGLQLRLQVSSAEKALGETTAGPGSDGYVQVDALAAGKYFLTVADPTNDVRYKKASLVPYRISARTTAAASWKDVSAPKAEQALDLSLGTWNPIRLPAKSEDVWYKAKVASPGRLRLVATSMDPKLYVSMQLWKTGEGGKLVRAAAESRLSTSRQGVASVTRVEEGETLIQLTAYRPKEGDAPAVLLSADLRPFPKFAARTAAEAPADGPVGPLGPDAETWLAVPATGPGRARLTLSGLAEPRSIAADLFFGPDPSKLAPIAASTAPLPFEISGGAQIWEIAVPGEGRLYARLKDRGAREIPFAMQAASEFLPAAAAPVTVLVPGEPLALSTGLFRTTVEAGQTATVAMFNRAWGISARLTLQEVLLPAQERPKILLLTRRRDDSIARRYPGLDWVRRLPEEKDPLRDLASFPAVVVDHAATPADFGLDQPAKWEEFAEKGGRVLILNPEFTGKLWGGAFTAGWSNDPVTPTPDLARLLPGLGDLNPEGVQRAAGTLALEKDSGFVPLATLKDPAKVVIAAKPVGKGVVVIDAQPFLRVRTPDSWDAKLFLELGLPRAHRWLGEHTATMDARGHGAELLALAPAAKTTYEVRVETTDARSEGGRAVFHRIDRTVSTPFEPNNAVAQATPLRSGQVVHANLTPAGDEDLFEVETPSQGLLQVGLLNVAGNQDIAVRAVRTPAGMKNLKASPRILHLVGGRLDYTLNARFADLAIRRIQHDAPEAKAWTDLLASADVAIMDGLTSLAQFAMDRKETTDKIQEWVRGGGRFILLCPQGITTNLLKTVVSASSQWDAGQWKAASLLDGISGAGNPSGWCCGNGAKFPHEIVLAFADRKPQEIDRFVVRNPATREEARTKDFEVFVTAGEDPAAGPWESLGKFVAKPTDAPQVFPFEKRSARFMKVVVTSNYGHPVETQLGEFEAYLGASSTIFGLTKNGWWNRDPLSRDPGGEAAFPLVASGAVNGWAATDSNGWWVGWKEAGFQALWTHPSGGAATAFRRLGKGTLIAEAQEIGLPANTAGEWKLYALLEFPRQLTPLGTWNGTQAMAGLGSESFEIPIREPGTVLLAVHDLRRGASDELYALRAQFKPVPVPFEPNDAPEQATVLPLGRALRASIDPPRDADWFTFHLRTEGTLRLRLSPLSPYLDPILALFHESDLQKPVAQWHRTQDHTKREEAVAFAVTRPGTHYLSLVDSGHDWNTPALFTLRADFDAAPAYEEPTDAPEKPRPLLRGFQTLSIAPANDTDWYAFEMKEAGELLLDLVGPMPWQNPAAHLYKADNPKAPLVLLNVEGDGASESFRHPLEPGKYLLQVFELGSDHGSLQRWKMRAEWPGPAETAAPRLTQTYPRDRSTRVAATEPIELVFDRPGTLPAISVEGSVSGAVSVKQSTVESTARLVPEKGLAPEETVTVRAGDAVFVFTTAPAIPESEVAVRPLKVILAGGRVLGAGKHDVAVVSSVELADAPILRFTPKGGKPIPAGEFTTEDQRTWRGRIELAKGLPEGMAVFEVVARGVNNDEIKSIEEATRTFLIDASAPSAPAGLAGRSRPQGSIELSWQPAAGETVARYVLYRNGEKVADVAAAATATDLPVAEGTYRYAVAAIDAAGNESARSTEVALVSDRTPPDLVPKGLSARIVDQAQIALAWEKAEGVVFDVYRSNADLVEAAKLQMRPVAQGLKDAAFVDRPGDGAWFYAVCAADPAGNAGKFSASAKAVVDTVGPLAVVKSSVPSPLGPGSYPLVVEFSEPLREAPRVYIAPRGKAEMELPVKPIDDLRFGAVLEVKAGFGEGAAAFRIVCTDLAGNPSRGGPLPVVIDTQGPTVKVRREKFSRLAAGRNRILFEGDEPLSKLTVTAVLPTGEKKPLAVGASTDTAFYADLDVAGSGKTTFEITAVDSAQRSTSQQEALEIDAAPPIAPADLVGAPADDRKIRLRWTAIPEEVTSYVLYRALSPETLAAGAIATVKETSYADAVTEERTYYYALRSIDLAGNESPLSQPIRVLADLTASGPPVLGKPKVEAGTVRLAWTAPPKEVTYNVYRETSAFTDRLGRQPVARKVAPVAFDDVPVLSGTYHYAVTAVDAAGNESRLSELQSLDFVQVRPTAALRPARPGPFRENVRISIEPLKPLVRPPTFGIVFADGTSLSLPVVKNGSAWEASLPVTAATPNGAARFLYHGESTDGVPTDLIASGGTLVIDTTAPSVSVDASAHAKPGPLAVRVRASEPLPAPPKLSLTLPGSNPRAVPLVEEKDGYVGRIEIEPGVKDGVGLFQVEATDAAGNVGRAIGHGERIAVDGTPPRPPRGLKVAPGKGGSVSLGWSPPEYARTEIPEVLAGYTVYRSEQPIADVSKLIPVAMRVPRVDHVDLTPSDGAWHYAVCSVDLAGNESPVKATGTATTDRRPPPAPRITSIALSASRTRVELAWEAEAEAAAFRVYRSKTPITAVAGLESVPIAEKKAADTPRETGRFYYAVTALDAVGNESAPATPDPIEYARIAPSAIVRLPAVRLRTGPHAVGLTPSRPLSEPPVLSVRYAGAAPAPVPLKEEGGTWTGLLTIDERTPEGPATFLFLGKAKEGNEPVSGDVITAGETFHVDVSPPTARVIFDAAPQQRDRAVVLRQGTFPFTLEASEPLAADPALTLLPRKGDPLPVSLKPIGERKWRGELAVTTGIEEGPATLEFKGKDLAGLEGNRLLEGHYVFADRTPPKVLDPVQAITIPGGKVRLAWNRPVDPGDVHFQIFRSNRKIESVSALSPLAERRAILSYMDTPTEDGTYYYVVRVADDAGNVGPPSAGVEVVCDKSAPAPPRSLKVREEKGVLHLTWTKPDGEKAFLYNAYISDTPIADTRGAKSLSGNIPGDFEEIYGAPEENGVYYIALTSIDASMNESRPSESVRFEYRKFPALARIRIQRPLESRVEVKGLKELDKKAQAGRINRVGPGRYEIRLTTSKLLAEPPELSYTPEEGAPAAIPMTGAGSDWSGVLEVAPDAKNGAAYFSVATKDVDGVPGKDILEGEYFAIDTAAPAAPPKFAAQAMTEESQGMIRLSWRTPEGEVPHFYRVYRSEREIKSAKEAVAIGVVRVQFENEDLYEYRDFPPRDGVWHYAVAGLDLAGNEGPLAESASAACRTTVPRATIRLFTESSGEQSTLTVGRGKIRVALESSLPLAQAPALSTRDVQVSFTGSGAAWTGEFQVPDGWEDGEAEFAFRGRPVTGEEGRFIASGKTFRVDRQAPMAEILIPRIAQLQVQLSWDGAQKHKLETPPLGVGVHEFELSVLRRMPDDERSARWARGDPGDPKELIGPPDLTFETSDGKSYPVPLAGFGARWHGRLVIVPEMANGRASFTFRGVDRFGNETRVLAPLRRWHVVDEADMSPNPRVTANYATTGGTFVIDTAAPGAPKLRDLVVRKLGVVEIGWEQPEGKVPASYRVYRSLFPITPENRGALNQDKVLARVWVDAPPHDGAWFYASTAVDLAGNEGPLSDSKKVFVDSIKPELKITPVPLDDDFVIVEVESDQPVLSLELRMPGQAQKSAILGGESGKLEKKPGGGYVYRQVLARPQLQEVFNGKVEVIVHSPDPVGNVVSTSSTMAAQTISSDTGGSVSSVDGQVQLVVPPGVKPVVPGKKEQRVTGKDDVFFVSYAYIPSKPKVRVPAPCPQADLARAVGLPADSVALTVEALRSGAKEPYPEDLIREVCAVLGKEVEIDPADGPSRRRTTDVDPLPPEIEVVGKPYVVQLNRPPEEPLELKASVTQADLSGLRDLPKLVMKIPASVADQYSEPEFMKKKIKVLAWNPAPEGEGKKPRWEVVTQVQLDPVTREIVVPADRVTTYVIVSERTPPSIVELAPRAGAVLSEPLKEISCRVVDKGTGVATGAENRVRVEFDGTPIDPAFVTLGEGDPTEVPVTFRVSEWLAKTKPESRGVLAPGPHRVRVYAQDIVENVGTLAWELTFDDLPPEVAAVYPGDGARVNTPRPAITALLRDNAGIDPGTVEVRIDRQPARGSVHFDEPSGFLSIVPALPLAEGEHALAISVKDYTGKAAKTYSGTFVVDSEGPRIRVASPGPGWIRSDDLRLAGEVTDSPSGVDPASVSVELDGRSVPAKLEETGTLSAALDAKDGVHRLGIAARDRAGNVTRQVVEFRADREAPRFVALGVRDRVAVRVVDETSGVDPATFKALSPGAYEWDPATGVVFSNEPVRFSIADRAGNVSVFDPSGVSRTVPVDVPKEKPPPPAPTPLPPPESGSPWPWVIVGLVALAAGVGVFLWKRRGASPKAS